MDALKGSGVVVGWLAAVRDEVNGAVDAPSELALFDPLR